MPGLKVVPSAWARGLVTP